MTWKHLFRSKGIDQITRELESATGVSHGLRRTLSAFDLTLFGIAAILGAGIFSTIGNAAVTGGPAVVFLFLFTAVACAFCAYCYAAFASVVPIAGSAYTYAYVSFGELIAWIIGWNLLMEYAIGDIAIAISWSQYLTSLLAGYGVFIPKHFTLDFLSAYRGFHLIDPLIQQGHTLVELAANQAMYEATYNIQPIAMKGYSAWLSAPRVFGLPIICDLPALLITMVITWVLFIGIEESKKVSQVLVGLKIFVVLAVIAIGATYVTPENWVPFAPQGVSGVLRGVSAVFFAYIGFDAISTTAEECKNPQRDLPRGMIYALVICTLLYIALALVLTGVVNYKKLGVGDPLSFIFGPQGLNLPWVSGMVAASAVIALATVLLVFQMGQTRIWMAMSRDGLLPPFFAVIHPKYRTPWISTIISGILVAIPSLFLNLTEVTDLNSIGTLFAFLLVCGGALRLQGQNGHHQGAQPKFKIPYVNSKFIYPALVILSIVGLWISPPDHFKLFLDSGAQIQFHHFPYVLFSVGITILSYLSFTRNLSLIPVLGLTTCGFLITELGMTNWIRFGIWLLIGMVIYFMYGFKKSKLRTQ